MPKESELNTLTSFSSTPLVRVVDGTDTANMSPANLVAETGAQSALDGRYGSRVPVAVPAAQYFIPGAFGVAANATKAMSANTLYYFPWVVAEDITIDRLAIQVQTASATHVARIGVYNADADFQPTSLVVGSSELSVASTGIKAETISTSLPAGNYVAVFHTDGTPTLAMNRASVGGWVGASQFLQMPTQLTVAGTYGALADPGTDWTTVGLGSATFEHVVFARKA